MCTSYGKFDYLDVIYVKVRILHPYFQPSMCSKPKRLYCKCVRWYGWAYVTPGQISPPLNLGVKITTRATTPNRGLCSKGDGWERKGEREVNQGETSDCQKPRRTLTLYTNTEIQ